MSEHHPSHSQGKSLAQWLYFLENLHATEIDLGLERIQSVANKLNIDLSFAKIITVAGTNGKGTTCAFIENGLLNEGRTVAVYSSPHLERFNERLRINKTDIDDVHLVQAFECIEHARGDISLTYYEYTTLAAFIVLMKLTPEVIILEVGLGGRLDATNIISADIAVVTTIDLDHQAFLGNDRETIGFEKAGIFRPHAIAVLGELEPPRSVIQHANNLHTSLIRRGYDFLVEWHEDHWQWSSKDIKLSSLFYPHIPRDNVATGLAVLSLLNVELSNAKVNSVIEQTRVGGRIEMFSTHCDVMLDVGHNPHAARYLAEVVGKKDYPRVHAVFGVLADKDIKNIILPLIDIVDHWYVGTLPAHRAASAENISEKLQEFSTQFNCFDNVTQAFKMACIEAKSTDLILVFGSFYTVAEIRRLLLN